MTSTGSWVFTHPLNSGRMSRSTENAVALDDGRVLLAGGADGNDNALATAELYNRGRDSWSPTGTMHVSRRISSATRLQDGRILVAGGYTDASFPFPATDTAELYDPETNSWTLTGGMHSPRGLHSATLLADGRVLVAGGSVRRSAQSLQSLASAELYDPATGIWTETAAMTDARAGHPAVLLHNGMVLVAGGGVTVGLGVDIGLSYCELYDPAAGTWTPTGSMATNREGHEGTLLDDGTVLVTGGVLGEGDPPNLIDDRSLGSAELYDPGAGAWTAVPEMEANRAWHRAILLSDGKVLVVGGTNPDDTPQVGLDAAEIYDPVTKTWSPAGRMDLGRYFFAAAHLPNGQVLVAGGVVETGSTLPSVISNTAELFSP